MKLPSSFFLILFLSIHNLSFGVDCQSEFASKFVSISSLDPAEGIRVFSSSDGYHVETEATIGKELRIVLQIYDLSLAQSREGVVQSVPAWFVSLQARIGESISRFYSSRRDVDRSFRDFREFAAYLVGQVVANRSKVVELLKSYGFDFLVRKIELLKGDFPPLQSPLNVLDQTFLDKQSSDFRSILEQIDFYTTHIIPFQYEVEAMNTAKSIGLTSISRQTKFGFTRSFCAGMHPVFVAQLGGLFNSNLAAFSGDTSVMRLRLKNFFESSPYFKFWFSEMPNSLETALDIYVASLDINPDYANQTFWPQEHLRALERTVVFLRGLRLNEE
jgi:hypothetical protein